jgi:hypothetical protein
MEAHAVTVAQMGNISGVENYCDVKKVALADEAIGIFLA